MEKWSHLNQISNKIYKWLEPGKGLKLCLHIGITGSKYRTQFFNFFNNGKKLASVAFIKIQYIHLIYGHLIYFCAT